MANKEKNYGIIFVELFPNGGNPLLEFQPFPPNFLLTFFGLCLGTIVLEIEKTLPYFFLCRRTLSVSSWILKWNIHLLRGDSPSLPLANQNTSQTLNSEHFPQHLKCFILCYWLTNYWIAHSACMSVCVCVQKDYFNCSSCIIKLFFKFSSCIIQRLWPLPSLWTSLESSSPSRFHLSPLLLFYNPSTFNRLRKKDIAFNTLYLMFKAINYLYSCMVKPFAINLKLNHVWETDSMKYHSFSVGIYLYIFIYIRDTRVCHKRSYSLKNILE